MIQISGIGKRLYMEEWGLMDLISKSTYIVAELINDKLLSVGDGYRAKNSELSAHGIPFARAGNINDGFNFSDADMFPLSAINKVGEKISRYGDTVFTSKGTVGRLAYVSRNDQMFVYSPQLCYWRSLNPEIIDPRFLFYWMHSAEFSSQVNSVKNQTDMAAYVSLNDQRKINITLPAINVQRAIAATLSCLDDKIELNNRMNKTLEEMAQAIFKRWFVDYEFPNEDGQPYKSRGGVMVDSELGEIPQGWRVGVLGDIGEVVGGATPSKANQEFYVNGIIPWVTPKDLSIQKSKYVSCGEASITQIALERTSLRMLPKGTILFSSRAPIGYMAIARNPLSTNQGFKSIIPHKEYGTTYLYEYIYHNINRIKALGVGSTFQEVSGGTMRNIEVIVPDSTVALRYNHTVNNLFEMQKQNEEQNAVLIFIRDTILPRLMDGQLALEENDSEER